MKIILVVILVLRSLTLLSSDTIVSPTLQQELILFIDDLNSKITEKTNNLEFNKSEEWWSNLLKSKENLTYKKLLKYKSKSLLSKNGCRFIFNFNNNFQEAVDDEDNTSYSYRYYAGLEWDLFKNGLLNSILKSKKQNLKNNIDIIKNKKTQLLQNIRNQESIIDKYFDGAVIKKLIIRQSIEEELYRLYRILFFERHFTKEDLIIQSEKLSRTNNELGQYKDSRFENIGYNLPLIEINVDSLLNSNVQTDDELIYENEIKNLSTSRYVYEDISLKPNVKYNYLNRTTGSVKTYVSAGITLGIPLSIGTKKSKIVNLEKELLFNNLEIKKRNSKLLLLNIIEKNQFHKKEILKLIRDKEVIDYKLRVIENRMLLEYSIMNGIEYIDLISRKLEKETEILNYNRKIYKYILNMSMQLGGINPYNYISELKYKIENNKVQGDRFIYAWSKFSKSIESDKLLAFLKEMDIDNALLSFGNQDSRKVEDYLLNLNKNNIKTYLLIGNNELVNKDDSYLHRYFKAKLRYSIYGINLDVEPHTFSDWKENKEKYYKQLFRVYNIAKQECDLVNKKFTISIPVFYNRSFLNKIKFLVDKCFLMAYGNTNVSVISRRIEEELTIFGKENIVIALRTKDFKDAIEREMFILSIEKRTGCNSIAYYKASTLFSM